MPILAYMGLDDRNTYCTTDPDTCGYKRELIGNFKGEIWCAKMGERCPYQPGQSRSK